VASITTHKHLQAIRDLPFCYVCGFQFNLLDHVDYDHVPPKTCFDKADRDPPLKLKTHIKCNNGNKLEDEKVGELIAIQRKKSVDPKKIHLNLQILSDVEGEFRTVFFDNLDLNKTIRRWVSGFHAALYQQPFDHCLNFSVCGPLQSAIAKKNSIAMEQIPDHFFKFVEEIKLNRAANNVDQIIANKEKFRYECVWAPEDSGRFWLCIFALNMYDWIELGDSRNFDARGCVGCYMVLPDDVPKNATRATQIQAYLADENKLNPFGN
jgi:hypothetical protein